MKTKQLIRLNLVVLCALPFAGSPLMLCQLDAAQPYITVQCSSNKLTLLWDGAPGTKLLQATNLAGAFWQEVPGSDGANSCDLPMTNAAGFFRLISQNTTGDGDALDDFTETNGWTIAVDAYGYGEPALVELRHVTSDPRVADTDGDGLDDFSEWLLGTDPRSADTDGDGLSDYDEWFRWHTSPTSVDTDGDARGPNHNLSPKVQLFDGNEVGLLHTSPTLEDTDGDGRTDYEEYDQPGGSPLIADVPKLDVQLVDAVDIRLDVQYAEELGKIFEYGTELAESLTTSSNSYNENSINAGVKIGAEASLGVKTSWTISGELSFGYGHIWSTTKESAQTTEKSSSEYTTDSRTRTETAASGSMSGGIRLVNTGPVTYTLTDFGLTVRYWLPGGSAGTNGSFKTLATLVPALGANGITLAPGDSTPVLQVQATGLNASRVKEFMARPNSLYLEPAYYELVNAQNLNFDFLEEITRWRTARIEIDYGNGRNETYRVATNVERNEDGTYAGATMGNVLSNILHIPFQTVPRRTLQPASPSNERVLYSLRDVATTSATNGFWVVAWSGAGTPQVNPNFEDLALQAGDQLLLTFAKDTDGDGLFATEELHFGTDDTASADSDNDGLTDVFEARTGWDVVLPTRSYHVYSDPRTADQDGDGLSDSVEFQKGTDPTKPDTDDDGLSDGLDPYPLIPAKVLRVNWTAPPGGNGSTWAKAFTSLQDALAVARGGQATTNDSSDDVAEIWVAAGTYKPTTTTTNRGAAFMLVKNTALYGGFSGVETKLSQREADPLLNGTILSGDLLSNDASTYETNSFADNSYHVCTTDYDQGSGAVLDGFTITGGNAQPGAPGSYFGGGLDVVMAGDGVTPSGPPPRLRNLFIRANHAGVGGGLSMDPPGANVSDCLFLQNSAEYSGGGIYVNGSSELALTNCQFIQNEVRTPNYGGGGGLYADGTVSIENCLFSLNTSKAPGGGVAIGPFTTARISRGRFLNNTSDSQGGGLALNASSGAGSVELVQSVFMGNGTTNGVGGGIYVGESTVPWGGSCALYIVNSSFCSNLAKTNSGGGIMVRDRLGTTRIENSILWNSELAITNSATQSRVLTSCLAAASQYPGAGNINADPMFVNPPAGDLRIDAASPCIDLGNNYVDCYPIEHGYQPLPATDLNGNWRVVDGNGDHIATVDMGACEYQAE